MRKITRILTITLFAVAIGAVFTQPAQAKSGIVKHRGIMAHYQYVNAINTFDVIGSNKEFEQVYEGHGVKIDYIWSPTDYYPGTKISKHSLGSGLGGGAITGIKSNGWFVSTSFLFYEYAFPFGLGLSVGLGSRTMLVTSTPAPQVTCTNAVFAGGITDLGLRYHFKNGLVFSFSSDLMGASGVQTCDSGEFRGRRSSNANKYNLLFSVGAGIGYWF